MPKTIEVPITWLQGLLKASEKVEAKKPDTQIMQADIFGFYTKVVSLQGYIDSVKSILGEELEEIPPKSDNPSPSKGLEKLAAEINLYHRSFSPSGILFAQCSCPIGKDHSTKF